MSFDYEESSAFSDPNENKKKTPKNTNAAESEEKSLKQKGKVFYCIGFGDCQMYFTRSEHLERHKRKHTGEKPFPCTFEGCPRFFSREDNMKQHAMIHTRSPKQKTKRGRKPKNSSNKQTLNGFPTPSPPSKKGRRIVLEIPSQQTRKRQRKTAPKKSKLMSSSDEWSSSEATSNSGYSPPTPTSNSSENSYQDLPSSSTPPPPPRRHSLLSELADYILSEAQASYSNNVTLPEFRCIADRELNRPIHELGTRTIEPGEGVKYVSSRVYMAVQGLGMLRQAPI
ncbi:MAG: hypothetical protein EXX96DRAFT_586040 [Benjaminiella poitrasii]|nr:MAG: hypothetical protein EXX96DRAFT_586040 [Benjaminiella poitrasii]